MEIAAKRAQKKRRTHDPASLPASTQRGCKTFEHPPTTPGSAFPEKREELPRARVRGIESGSARADMPTVSRALPSADVLIPLVEVCERLLERRSGEDGKEIQLLERIRDHAIADLDEHARRLAFID